MSDFAVEHFVHKGSMRSHNFKPDLSRCRFSVAEHGRVTDWHQCNRKPVEKVEGYDFCKQHANEVKSRLGIRIDATKTKYAASFSYGEPNLIELEILGETEKTIEVVGYKSIFGTSYAISQGRQNKDSRYMRGYKFFDDYDMAIAWLYQTSKEQVKDAQKRIEKAEGIMRKLEAMVSDSVEQRR